MSTHLRLGCLAFALLAGCASLDAPQRDHLAAGEGAVRACAAWFRDLDATIDQAGVRDAAAYRVPGYPYLRLDRFTASFTPQAAQDARSFYAWLERARALDHEARRVELRNLPRRAWREDFDAALRRSEDCAAKLATQDLASEDGRRRLFERAAVPDDYVGWQRVVGLYAITHVPFSAGIDRWQAETVESFRATQAGAAPEAPLQRYAPALDAALSESQVGEILARAPRDALGVPRLAASDLEQLFASFAPLFEIETAGSFDRPGAPYWGDSPVPQVDATRPTVYRRLAFTRYGDEVLPQLVYTLWFSERPGDDILAGKLDGVVWRVTLASDGAPLVYDSIHPCGCFHMFFPTARVEPLPSPDPYIEWAFAPRPAPDVATGARIVLRVATRTHYLKGLATEPRDRAAAATLLAPEDENALRALPLPSGGTRSLYGADGIVAGSERPERELFWPMGIPSAGAMRQWGKHATAFVGKRHFDDADLIALRFRHVAP